MNTVTIQLKRGPQEIWNSLNPVLAYGEPGYEQETRQLKIGDGKTAWLDLPYQNEGNNNFLSYSTSQELSDREQLQIQKNMGLISTKPQYYTTFAQSIADLNADITDNADATAENAVCYISKDADCNTCLVLLSDVELTGDVEITVDVILNVNGHTIFFAGDYSLKFSGDRSILDCRVEGSRVEKTIDIAEGRVYTIDFAGAYGELLGGEISYSAASVSSDATNKSTPNVVVNNRNNRLVIDGCQISAEFGGGDEANKYIVVASNECIVKNTNITGLAYGVTTETTKRTQMYCINLVQVGKSCHIENCNITAVSTYSGTYAYGIAALPNKNSGILEIKNTSVHIDSLSSGGAGIYMLENTITSLINTTSFTDGTTGSVAEGNENRAGTLGIINYGTMTLKDCSVYGTHSGIQCSGGSITKINGGLFEGTGHGGLYIACPNAGKFYAENAIFRTVPYNGKHKDMFYYLNGQYLVAAVYVGGGNNIKAYMNNCILDGTGPALNYNYDGDPNDRLGAEPIRFRHSNQETNNAVYMSNCTLKGDGKIRFANASHTLYLGYGNRVMCDANLDYCVNNTAYANTIFTSWEE